MKFRFCRDCDCPDWLLAEIQILAKIKPLALKEFTLLIARSISGADLDYDCIHQLLTQTNFDESTIQASVAALRWILSNASGALIDASVLHSELQQLGLPKEQSEALTETFRDQRETLIESLKKQTLKASGDVNWSYDIKSIHIGEEKEPVLQLNVEGNVLDQEKGFRVCETSKMTEEREKLSIFMSHDQLGSLIYELEDAYKHMKELSSSQ